MKGSKEWQKALSQLYFLSYQVEANRAEEGWGLRGYQEVMGGLGSKMDDRARMPDA